MFYIYWKISSVAPRWRTWIKDAPLMGYMREKSSAPSGIWTHNLSVTKRVLYRCATTDALIVYTWLQTGFEQLNAWVESNCSSSFALDFIKLIVSDCSRFWFWTSSLESVYEANLRYPGFSFYFILKTVHNPMQIILLSCSLIKVWLNWIASNT